MQVYDEIAKVYEETYGEPLVADWSWVEPLFEGCELAVAATTDMSYDDFVGGAQHDEVVERTAAVIATITHGVKVVVTTHARLLGVVLREVTS